MFDFDYYLKKAIKVEVMTEEETTSTKEESPLFQDEEEFEKKRKILVTWMKKLNEKFKPYAVFKIIINENEDGKDLFLSLKAKGEQMNDFFYHVTPTTSLNRTEFEKVLKLAEEQIKAMTLKDATYN